MGVRNILMLVNVPSVCTKAEFVDVMNAATVACNTLQRRPDSTEVARWADTAPKKIVEIMETHEFIVAMRSRGYEFTNTDKLTPQQVWAVSIITNPTNRRPLKDKLAQAGISYATYRAWLNQPVFARYIKELGERLLNDHVQDVHTRVVERAANGDIAAMRLYYDLTGRTDSATNKAVQDLSATVRLLLEVITRNVTDTNVLARITSEIAEITDGRGSGNSINKFEFENIVKGEKVLDRPIENTELPKVPEENSIGDSWANDKPKPIRSI